MSKRIDRASAIREGRGGAFVSRRGCLRIDQSLKLRRAPQGFQVRVGRHGVMKPARIIVLNTFVEVAQGSSRLVDQRVGTSEIVVAFGHARVRSQGGIEVTDAFSNKVR